MERKYLDRREWTRVEKRRQRLIRMEGAALCGYAAAIWIDRVKSPLVKTIGGRRLMPGISGCSCCRMGKNWALTIMYNERRETVQFYFDITRRNTVSGDGRPCFGGLYLDVVFFPDGGSLLLDEDGLDDARRQGEVRKEEAAMARRQAQAILQEGRIGVMKLSRSLLEHFGP